MTQLLKRRAAAIALACLVAAAPPALATTRPYAVEDLLELRTLGPAMIDPSQRWLVVGTTAPWSRTRTEEGPVVSFSDASDHGTSESVAWESCKRARASEPVS